METTHKPHVKIIYIYMYTYNAMIIISPTKMFHLGGCLDVWEAVNSASSQGTSVQMTNTEKWQEPMDIYIYIHTYIYMHMYM